MPTGDVIPLDVYVGQDFYVPAFRLMIRGQDAEVQDNDVISVTYEDSLDKIDSFNLTVMDWKAETPTFRYSDAHTFDPGQEVELLMGYYENGNGELRVCSSAELLPFRQIFRQQAGQLLRSPA